MISSTTPTTTTTTPSGTKNLPSLEEYASFHGRFCSHSIAKICMDSFRGKNNNNGVILTLPHDYTKNSLESYHCRCFNLWTYYYFWSRSFTGILSMLFGGGRRCTKTLLAIEYTEEDEPDIVISRTVAAQNDRRLRIEPFVWKYLEQETGSFVFTLVRQFEYDLLGIVSATMVHVRSTNDDRLHLIEVYRFHNPVLSSMCKLVWNPLLRIGNLLLSATRRSKNKSTIATDLGETWHPGLVVLSPAGRSG